MLGGSFNPVHRGHLALAQAVRDQLSFDRVLLVPANISPGKDSDFVADGADRMEMLRLAVENLPGIEAESCELDRGGVSWSIDTLCTLSERYSGQLTEPVAMIIGQDLTASFGRWKEAERIAREFRIIVACRPPWNAEEFQFSPQYGNKSSFESFIFGDTVRYTTREALGISCPGAGQKVY